jgi:hypothetical protein
MHEALEGKKRSANLIPETTFPVQNKSDMWLVTNIKE